MKKILPLIILSLATFIILSCGRNDEYHQVIFLNIDGSQLLTVEVKHGNAAVAPTPPNIPGYTFTRWDKNISKINTTLTVTALYNETAQSSAFRSMLENARDANNITQTTRVYLENELALTENFVLDDIYIYFNRLMADANEDFRLFFYLSIEDNKYTLYETFDEDDCWTKHSDIPESFYANIFLSSRSSMLPTDFEIYWFEIDGNTYTLKPDYFQSMYDATPAVSGAFSSYKLILSENIIELIITLRDAFGVLNTYDITFKNIGTTEIVIDNLNDACPVD